MGVCYSVTLKITVADESGAIKALNEHIKGDNRTDYALEYYQQRGVSLETIDGLMKIFLGERDGRAVDISKENDFIVYTHDFDAGYGWERVMLEMFQVLTPFLRDGSELSIWPDDDYDYLVVKDGQCVRLQ